MKRLLVYLKPYKKQCILGPLFKLLEAVLELFLPYIMILLVDNGVKQGNWHYVWMSALVMFAVATVGVAFAFTCQYYASVASQGFGTKVRNALFSHILHLSLSDLDAIGTEKLITRITVDTNNAQTGVAMVIRLFLRIPFIVIGSIVMILSIDFHIAAILLVVIPVFCVIIFFLMRRSFSLFSLVQQKLDALALVLRENLSGVRIVRAFANESYEAGRFAKANEGHAATAIKTGKINALMNPMTTVIINFSILFILHIGGAGINTGSLTQGELIACINYMTQILFSLIVLANLVPTISKAMASARRISSVLAISASVADGEITEGGIAENAVEFENVTFRYTPTADDAVENISFTIKKGQTAGIIGGTGSGKTTLLNLLQRYYTATGGTVRLFGKDVRDYSQKTLHSLLGVAPQKAVLFRSTVGENIAWGQNGVTAEDVFRAAETAQCGEFISKMPQKMNEAVEQGGKNLSGGQKQRLAIARAICRRPPVVVLDDSFSALDFATEAKVLAALEKELAGSTKIIVSQRAATIMGADIILVLDDGVLAGAGRHSELLKTCPVYRDIYESQQKEASRHA